MRKSTCYSLLLGLFLLALLVLSMSGFSEGNTNPEGTQQPTEPIPVPYTGQEIRVADPANGIGFRIRTKK